MNRTTKGFYSAIVVGMVFLVLGHALDRDALYNKGIQKYRQGDYRAAVDIFNEILTEHPRDKKVLDYIIKSTDKLAEQEAGLVDEPDRQDVVYVGRKKATTPPVAVPEKPKTLVSRTQEFLQTNRMVLSSLAGISLLILLGLIRWRRKRVVGP